MSEPKELADLRERCARIAEKEYRRGDTPRDCRDLNGYSGFLLAAERIAKAIRCDNPARHDDDSLPPPPGEGVVVGVELTFANALMQMADALMDLSEFGIGDRVRVTVEKLDD